MNTLYDKLSKYYKKLELSLGVDDTTPVDTSFNNSVRVNFKIRRGAPTTPDTTGLDVLVRVPYNINHSNISMVLYNSAPPDVATTRGAAGNVAKRSGSGRRRV